MMWHLLCIFVKNNDMENIKDNVLIYILEHGDVEFRDGLDTCENYCQSNPDPDKEELKRRYFRRNPYGAFKYISDLESENLVECDTNAWHPTYILTPEGKGHAQILLRQRNLDIILSK